MQVAYLSHFPLFLSLYICVKCVCWWLEMFDRTWWSLGLYIFVLSETIYICYVITLHHFYFSKSQKLSLCSSHGRPSSPSQSFMFLVFLHKFFHKRCSQVVSNFVNLVVTSFEMFSMLAENLGFLCVVGFGLCGFS